MKHMKDRAVAELTELRRQNRELQERVAGMEEEMARIRESMSHASMKIGVQMTANFAESLSSAGSVVSRGRTQQQMASSTGSSLGRSPSLSKVGGQARQRDCPVGKSVPCWVNVSC